jgi:subtilase family serine protease
MPNAFVTVSVPYALQTNPGVHAFTMVVDDDCQIPETNENNNSFTLTVRVDSANRGE